MTLIHLGSIPKVRGMTDGNVTTTYTTVNEQPDLTKVSQTPLFL